MGAWILGVAVISILLMPVVFFPMSLVWDFVEVVVLDSYTFTGVFASALTVVEVFMNYMLVFGLLFVVNWAIVQAKARSYQQ